MQLSDLFFWTDCRNRVGFKNIGGDELAALLAASGLISSPHVGLGAAVHRNDAVAIADNNAINVTFQIEDYDDLGFFDLAGDATKLTIPALTPPIQRVVVGGGALFDNTANGTSNVAIRRNGSILGFNAAGVGTRSATRNFAPGLIDAQVTTITSSLKATAGDEFQLVAGVNDLTPAANLSVLQPTFYIYVLR